MNHQDTAARARQIVSMLDLTTLSGQETEAEIDALCGRASGPCGRVAALCVFSRHVPRVCGNLRLAGLDAVNVATVANFPAGDLDLAGSIREIRASAKAGASEIDLVFPYRAFLQGREEDVRNFLSGCREACPVTLKVILESGVLGDAGAIRAASLTALDCGADFLKTSTGKTPVHATPEAAKVMLQAIAEKGSSAGFKASGGLRRMADALVYLELAEEILGPAWVSSRTLRFGASGLLDDLLNLCAGSQAR